MATSHENEASCVYDEDWEEYDIFPESISPDAMDVKQLFAFDRARAIRRTELELHRIRQFAREVGVTIPYHFWDALRRVLTLRFGLTSFQCPCCEDSESKTFIMGVIALAFINPDPSCSLFVNETINGWINQVAGHLLNETNTGGTSREEACNLLSDLFVALDSTKDYTRPTFEYGTSKFTFMRKRYSHDYFIIIDQHCPFTNDQIELLSVPVIVNGGACAVLSQSNDRSDALRVDSNVLYLNIPQDRMLTTEISGSFHLHSLKELSLICVMGSVNSPGKSTFPIHVKDFKDEISSFFKRLSTVRDSKCLASELKQLKQSLEKFTNSTIYSRNCSIPEMSSLKLHSQMRDHIDFKFKNSNDTINLLLQHSNVLHTVLEDLRQETFTHNISEMNRVPHHERIGQNNFIWFLSSLKALDFLIRSRPTGLLDDETEAKHLELNFRGKIAELGLWKPLQIIDFDSDNYYHHVHVRRRVMELYLRLNDLNKFFLQKSQSNNFHIDAIRLQISHLLYENQIIDDNICLIDLYVPQYLQDVYSLDEFGLNLKEVTDSSLTRFFIARLLDDVRTIETYVEHVGKVYDLFSVLIKDVRHLLDRNLYARFCLEQVLPKQIDIDYLLDNIDLSIDY